MGSYKDLGKTQYPEWKKIAWRFGRVFISAFLVAGAPVLIGATTEVFASWENFKSLLAYPFLFSGLTAGVVAIGKTLRVVFGSEDQNSLIDKLII